MGRHVLLADASPAIQTLVRLLLAGEQVDLSFSSTVPDAAQAALERGASLVLADLLLPGGGGVELARQLRGRVPVAVLTPPQAKSDPAAGAAAGAIATLAKPLDRPTFLALVRRVVGPASAPPAAPRATRIAESAAEQPANVQDEHQRASVERLVAELAATTAGRVVEARLAELGLAADSHRLTVGESDREVTEARLAALDARAAEADRRLAELDARLAELTAQVTELGAARLSEQASARIDDHVAAAVQHLVGERAEAMIRAELDRLLEEGDA